MGFEFLCNKDIKPGQGQPPRSGLLKVAFCEVESYRDTDRGNPINSVKTWLLMANNEDVLQVINSLHSNRRDQKAVSREIYAANNKENSFRLPMWTSSAADDLSVVGSLMRTAFSPFVNSSPRYSRLSSGERIISLTTLFTAGSLILADRVETRLDKQKTKLRGQALSNKLFMNYCL